MVDENPGVIYPTNLTPDTTTGIGGRSASDIARLIKSGQDGHSRRLNTVMPWPSYAKIDKDDAMAIAVYLLSLPPVSHRVPDPVAQGQVATAPYVHFGISHGL